MTSAPHSSPDEIPFGTGIFDDPHDIAEGLAAWLIDRVVIYEEDGNDTKLWRCLVCGSTWSRKLYVLGARHHSPCLLANAQKILRALPRRGTQST